MTVHPWTTKYASRVLRKGLVVFEFFALVAFVSLYHNFLVLTITNEFGIIEIDKNDIYLHKNSAGRNLSWEKSQGFYLLQGYCLRYSY